MVVQEDDDALMEAPLSKSKKYVVVKNHVRELLPENEGQGSVTSDREVTENSNIVRKNPLKRKRTLQKMLPSMSEPSDISESDLEELRTVYRKCKAVLNKIESKYGHLLNLEDTEPVESLKNTTSDESSCDYCTGFRKKKIVFDENGQQLEKDYEVDRHVCLKRIKKSHIDLKPHKSSIQVEYDNININLPNDLQGLENILKDVNISRSYRQLVIDKIYLLRQEYLCKMRYERQDIIKQLKENPDDLLGFKGTNLSSLTGYPVEPVEKTKKN